MNCGLFHRRAAQQSGAATLALAVVLFVAASTGVYFSRTQLQRYQITVSDDHPPLYLPHARYVRLFSLGYDSVLSKALWFNTINYFGKQFASTQDYRWLGHMCELVTSLDRNAAHAFEFCATLLSWVAKDPRKSNELLSAAIEHNPHYWRFLYLRGFNNWYFLEKLDLAKADFLAASTLDGAPPFLASLASRLVAEENGPTLARQFLQEMIANTSDPAAQKALKRKLKRAKLSEAMQSLQAAVDRFAAERGRAPHAITELVDAKYIQKIPREPYKGEYFIENGEVKTSSKRKGLKFAGKTAKTGVFREEFQDLE